MKIALAIEIVVMASLTAAAQTLSATPAEMDEARQWAAAKFEGIQGASLQDGTTARRGRYTNDPFFAFTYGGRPSSDFLSAWKSERTIRRLDDARKEHTVTYTDPATGLIVRSVGIEYLDFPTIEWTLYFKNSGVADTPILSDIQAIDTRIERNDAGEFTLHRHTGDICAPESYQPHLETMPPKSETHIANTGGRPTQSAFPYFNIEWPGEGLICVVSWAGQWASHFARDEANGLRIRAGQELTHFTLHPGEEVRSPMVVLQFYKGDWLRAQNVWRRWMFAHNLPRPGGKPLKPQSSLCTGNYYPNLMTVAAQEKAFLQRHIDERIPFDCWWQDAGWYPCDGVGWPKVGTWEVDPVRFPKGLRELSDLMHTQGKLVMVWFEPERVHTGTWIADNHPEWVYGGNNGGLLKLGEPECRAWLTGHIDKVITEQGIDYYRQDFNIDPLPFWRGNDAEDRQGITEIRHVEGYFAYWDDLRRRHPNMLIDSCASGGRRNDLETLRRAVPLLRSDWYAGPAGQQCLTYGLSLWVPYHGTGFIYEKDEYWVRSGMVAEMSYGPGAEGVDKLDFDRLRRLTEEHLRIAPYFLGDFFPLTPYSLAEDQWMAWQFDRPDLGEGVIQVFRRQDSVYEAARFRLRELDPQARYRVTDLDDGSDREVSGSDLLRDGLLVTAEKQPCALVFVYKRLP
jgi:alpha-galactosidase